MDYDTETPIVANPVANGGPHSLFDVQIELEKDISASIDAKLYSAPAKAQFSQTVQGSQMLRNSVHAVAEGIREWFEDINESRAAKHAVVGKKLAGEDPDMVAYLTVRTVLNLAHKNVSVVRMATTITRAILQEKWLREFRKTNRQLFNRLEKDMKSRRNTVSFKSDVWVWAANKDGFVPPPRWPQTDLLNIGVYLIEILVARTGWFELYEERLPGLRRRTQKVLVRTKTFNLFVQYWLQTANIKPEYLPTVVPPREWTSWWGGGYHTDAVPPLRLVKTVENDFVKSLDGNHPVVKAVNAVQAVPWRVNTRVLDVMREAVQARMDIGKLPMLTENVAYAPKPVNATKDELSDWRLGNIRLFEAVREAESNWLQVMQIVRLADQFKDYDRIYFPHTMDFRGRMYPVVPIFNPQGTDYAKGLLTFANGKSLGESGKRWLYIHGANCWDNGLTKQNFQARVDWVKDNITNILQSAENPLDFTWWSQAEEPWQFLAFCFAVKDYRENPSTPITLPVGMDGTCNGLQHFSAMLRDPVGGRATNLVDSDKPADIYQSVADVVNAELKARMANGDAIARTWFEFGVDRKSTKRQVMTLPYGSTQFSCLQYTREWYLEKAGRNTPFSREAELAALTYLSKLIWDSIGKVVVAAREAMDWLKACAETIGERQIVWTTPLGFKVYQNYRETKQRRIRTVLFGTAYRPRLNEETDKISRREQRNGISPNFVHSFDAAHMQATVLDLLGKGIQTFAFVHDNYLCLAQDGADMAGSLRETFVRLHGVPALQRLYNEFLEQGHEVPKPPQVATLDVASVRRSPYFFA